MGWIQKLRKKARSDTPEGLAYELDAVKAKVKQEITDAMERCKRRTVEIMERLKAIRKRHGMDTNAIEYAAIEADLSQAIEEVRSALGSSGKAIRPPAA